MKFSYLLPFALGCNERNVAVAALEDSKEIESALELLEDQREEMPLMETREENVNEEEDMMAMKPGSLLDASTPQKNIDLEAACEEVDSQVIPDGPNYICLNICGTNRAVFAVRLTVDPFLGAVAGAAKYEYGLVPYYPGRNSFCFQRVDVGSSQANEDSCEFLVQRLSPFCDPWCEFRSDFDERRLGEDGAEANFGVCTLNDYCDTFAADFSGSRTFACEGDLTAMYSITYTETMETCGGNLLEGDDSICFINNQSRFYNAYTEIGLGYKREFTFRFFKQGVDIVDEFTGQFLEGSTTQLASCTLAVSGTACECTVCNDGQLINGALEFGSICVIKGQAIVRECGSELTYRDVLFLYDAAVNAPVTPSPTVRPSVRPSVRPTISPSARPTASVRPSVSPTASPSTSAAPSFSTEPSISDQPSTSSMPSITAVPSISFSPSVGDQPSTSSRPSVSSRPSMSSAPSQSASPTASSASQAPSLSNMPSESNVPTAEPTFSRVPTERPSVVPSRVPTGAPIPSMSSAPSQPPTASAAPTMNPSFVPSEIPSVVPSVVPSEAPSATVPTSAPSLF